MLVTSLAICLTIFLDALHGVDSWADAVSGGWLTKHMRFSRWFVGDTLLAGIFAVDVFAAKFARLEFGMLSNRIKFVASFTFIFYMAHGIFIRLSIQYSLGMLFTTVVAFVSSFLLGLITERPKDRLQRFLARVIDRVSSKLPWAGTRDPVFRV